MERGVIEGSGITPEDLKRYWFYQVLRAFLMMKRKQAPAALPQVATFVRCCSQPPSFSGRADG